MNFLAHLLLSGDREEVIIGNLAGDFVKGRLDGAKTLAWDKRYLLGLRLHRHIDSFTDGHPVVRQARAKLSVEFGKLSGIIIDIFFDYFLAKNFDQFCHEDLGSFADRMYALLAKRADLIPAEMERMVHYMVTQDWLRGYATLEGIDLTFYRLSRRTDYLAGIVQAGKVLARDEAYYSSEFFQFFPELEEACRQFLHEEAALMEWDSN